MKFKNQMIGWTLFSTVLSLFIMAYAGVQDLYSLTPTDVDASGNDVLTAIQELNIIEGMTALAEGLHSLATPGNIFDVLGGLLSLGIGAIQTLTGLVTTPIEVLTVIMGFYTFIPDVVFVAVGAIFLIYAGFTILEAYTGRTP